MNVKHLSYKFIAVALAVILLFTVSFDTPVSVKAADSPDFVYEETTLSVTDVKAEITALAPAAVAIIVFLVGFILYTYFVWRNVSVPIEFSSSDGFIGKCNRLGQYAFDNMTDNLKNIFHSMKNFRDNHPEWTTTAAITAFVAKNLVDVARDINSWINSSLVNDRSDEAQDLLDILAEGENTGSPTITDGYSSLQIFCQSEWDYASTCLTKTTNSSIINGLYIGMTSPYNNTAFRFNDGFFLDTYNNLRSYANNGRVLVFGIENNPNSTTPANIFYEYTVTLYIYQLTDGVYTKTSIPMERFPSANTNPYSYSYYPASGSANTSGIPAGQYFSDGTPSKHTSTVYNNSLLISIINELVNCGVPLYVFNTIFTPSNWRTPTTLDFSQCTAIVEVPELAPDIPSPIDISGGEDVIGVPDEATFDPNAVARDLGASALTLDELRELLRSGATTINLESAISSALTLPSGSYNVPSLDGVWKYPRYMFATLGSYIVFLGTALRSVTIGEGGLSWLFYGAFVLLVCGGVIGKMLL